MKIKTFFFFSVQIILLLLTACNMPGETDPTPDLVATQVARLLTEAPTTTQMPAEEDSQPTPSATIPEATGTPTNTNTPTLTHTPTDTQDINDPAQILGAPAWTEDFSGNSSPWDFDSPQATFEVVNGALSLTAKTNPNWHSWYVSSPKLKNAYVEANVELANCSGNDRFGLAVRSNSDGQQFYFMGITCDGQWGFFQMSENVEITQISPFQDAEILQDNPNRPHRVGIWMDGSSFTFYIDGEEVGTATDDTLESEGYTGFLIAYANNSGFTVRVDQIRYWNLP
jgi:hypothetical protein